MFYWPETLNVHVYENSFNSKARNEHNTRFMGTIRAYQHIHVEIKDRLALMFLKCNSAYFALEKVNVLLNNYAMLTNDLLPTKVNNFEILMQLLSVLSI